MYVVYIYIYIYIRDGRETLAIGEGELLHGAGLGGEVLQP